MGAGGANMERQYEQAGWARAWHGPKLEAPYSVAYIRRLLKKSHQHKGERLFAGTPGVYLHKDGTQHKTEYYIRLVQIGRNGVFYENKLGSADAA